MSGSTPRRVHRSLHGVRPVRRRAQQRRRDRAPSHRLPAAGPAAADELQRLDEPVRPEPLVVPLRWAAHRRCRDPRHAQRCRRLGVVRRRYHRCRLPVVEHQPHRWRQRDLLLPHVRPGRREQLGHGLGHDAQLRSARRSYRFGDGYLRVYTSGISPAVQVHASATAGAGSTTATSELAPARSTPRSSVNWARDRTYVRDAAAPGQQRQRMDRARPVAGVGDEDPQPALHRSDRQPHLARLRSGAPSNQDWQGATQQGSTQRSSSTATSSTTTSAPPLSATTSASRGRQIALHREGSGRVGQPSARS